MREHIEQEWMAAVGVVGLAFALAAAGCAGMERAPSAEPAVTPTPPAAAVAPSPFPAGGRKVAAVATKREARQVPPAAAETPGPVAVSTDAPIAALSDAPVAGGQHQVSAPAQAAGSKDIAALPAPPPGANPAPPVAAKPALPAAKPAAPPAPNPPPLDLTALEKRLKETGAIGVFTKLTLKNQVDELLGRFRAFYEGRLKTTLIQLRQPYDLLMLKVLSLLQDSDPSLARAITDSREAIWGILTDPNKFKNL